MSQRRSRAEWEELVRACGRSGVSAARFAEGPWVNVSTRLWWRSRLRKLPFVEPKSPAPRRVERVRPSIPAGGRRVGDGVVLTSESTLALRVQLGSAVVVCEGLPPPQHLVTLAAELGATAS